MELKLFAGQDKVRGRAMFIAERLDLREFEKAHCLAKKPLLLTAGGSGCAALFRYGAVVQFGLSAIEETTLLESLKNFVREPFDRFDAEEFLLSRDATASEGIEGGHITLPDFSIERLQLVAEVLAKSVVLDRYEAVVSRSFQRIEPLAETLQRSGRPGSRGRELLRHIGDTLSIQGRMVGRVELPEKPDLLWYHPQFEHFYARLKDEYELHERHLAVERKLDLISRTAETLLGILQNRRSLRVEWYITILIVLEILLTLYQMFWVEGS